jgi:ribonucleoside-triphosphate reductase
MDYGYWDNLSTVVTKRTYSRNDTGKSEDWLDIVERVIGGNVRNHDVSEDEINNLREIMSERKGLPAGRGLWFSGSPSHDTLGGAALNNCYYVSADLWENFVWSQDMLMLGGGVGMSVEQRFVSKLPHIKKGVVITCKNTADAHFIVPDSREGWNKLFYHVLEAFFVTGKGFTYSTICVRGKDEPIKGFGGSASGPQPLIAFIEKICILLTARGGKHVRPIDAMDILCCTGEMVVSGNVRRSAIIILGDAWDREYLTAKRWDLKEIPSHRAYANLSVICSDVEDLHPSFWKTYEHGEPYGLVNRANMQKYGRMGEELPDTAVGMNPCAEATLESHEPCNLQEMFLPRITGPDELAKVARLLHRYGKRVCAEHYHDPKTQEVVSRNARVGTGITGCLQSPLFAPDTLDFAYNAIQEENVASSKEYNLPLSIRTTVVKPSGTLSLVGDVCPGIHPYYAEWYIRRVRFSANDKLIPLLKAAGHPMEYVQRFDGTRDPNTVVVSFYKQSPAGAPTAKTFDTWQQLDTLVMAQKHWADQAVSVTVYYKKAEIAQIKEWLAANLCKLKSISFLCHDDHGFAQAPLEEINEVEFQKASSKIKQIEGDVGEGEMLEGLECEGGACPVR